MVAAANAGSKIALADLRQALDANPSIWEQVGDLGAHAQASLIRAVAGNDQLFTESLQRKAADLKRSLLSPNPLAVEELAAERVVACWLQMQHLDGICTQFGASPVPEAPDPRVAPKQEVTEGGTSSNLQQFLAARREQQTGHAVHAANGSGRQPMSLKQAAFWTKLQDQSHRRFEAAMKLLITTQALKPSVAAKQPKTKAAEPSRVAEPTVNGSQPPAAPTEPLHTSSETAAEEAELSPTNGSAPTNGHDYRNRLRAFAGASCSVE
jgi:hypothetical protein